MITPAPSSDRDAAAVRKFRDKIDDEIRHGLPREQERRTEALRALDYYQRRGVSHIQRRDAETDDSFRNRPKRSIPLTRRVVDVLCSKLYSPGPSRSIDDETAAEWLEGVYADNLVNSLWQRAARMSTLNAVAAFQVAATGDPAHPIKYQLWCGRNEIVPYEMPGRANEVAAVVTIDTVDNLTRYTYWTADWYRVYETDKLRPGQTADGRSARYLPDQSGENPYGIIPFAFVWAELPVSGFDAVTGLGPFLADLNSTIDEELSDMALAVRKYHTPTPVIYDGDVGFQPIRKAGEWLRVNSTPFELEKAPPPRLEFLQAQLDIAGGWTNIRSVIDSELEALGIPLTAYRMDSNTLPSGAALVAEQMPLIEHARELHEPYRKYEDDLKTVTFQVGGAYYGRPDLQAAAALPLSVTSPPVTIDLPGADRDAADAASVEGGYESPVMVVMRRFGLTRDQAVQHLRRVIEDHAELVAMQRDAGMPTAPAPTPSPDATPARGARPDQTTQADQGDPDEPGAEADAADVAVED